MADPLAGVRRRHARRQCAGEPQRESPVCRSRRRGRSVRHRRRPSARGQPRDRRRLRELR